MKKYPKLLVILHEGEHELVETIPDETPLKLRMFYFLHLENVSALRVLQVLLHVIFII